MTLAFMISKICGRSYSTVVTRYSTAFHKTGTLKTLQQCFRKYNLQQSSCKPANNNLQLPSLKLFAGSFVILKLVSGSLKVSCKQASTLVLPPDLRNRTEKNKETDEDVEKSDEANESEFDWAYFWKLLKPQFHYFIGAVGTALVVAIANVQIPLLLGEIVNVVAEFSQNAAGVDISDFWEQISTPAFKLIKLYIVQASFTFGYITCLTLMGERLAVQLRQELFDSLLRQDIAFYDEHKTGEVVNRLTSDVQDFKSSFKMCVSQGIRSITQMIGCGISLYKISPSLAGVTAVLYTAIITIGTTLGGLLRSLSRKAQQEVAASTGVAEECIGNVRTVRSFASEPYEMEMFSKQLEKSKNINETLGFGIGLFQAGSNLFLNGVVLGVLYHGGSLVARGDLRPGDLMTYLAASQTMQKSLSQLSVLFGYYVRGVSAASRVFEYVKLTPDIPLQGGRKIPYHSLCGSVKFDRVSFNYPTRPHQRVLDDFSLEVPAGKVVALVGESGAGKTTIGHLLERFYDVFSGSVSIDGEDIRTLDPAWLRGQLIGFIHQEPVLFATTVMENIRYGKPNATDEEVIAASKIANADGFINTFPSGYSTVVGERGVTVSGGQKQRIAIARALLKNPRILVLDEATSALDAESERVVQTALEECSVGRTVIVIAHRLSTIQSADVIAVMNRGKLVEIGSHESLKRKGGYYADLIKQQQKQ